MRIIKSMTALAGAAILATVLAACSGPGADAEPNDEGSDAGPNVGVILLQGDTYYQQFQSSLEAAVEADGGSVTAGVSNGDPATENQLVRNMIQAQVDAILMQPAADEASLATMKAVKEAGIALICYGNCVGATAEPGLADGVIQSDNTALGTGTGEVATPFIQEAFGNTVKLAILNCDVASACKQRKAGFLEVLEGAGITVDVVTDQEGFLVDKATPVAASILTAHPDIDMIWGSNDGGTAGATIAVKQAGKSIPVFGTDVSPQLIEFLKSDDNILLATTGQDAAGTARGAYDMAKKVMDGGTNEPFAVELPGIVYDRENPETLNSFTTN